MDKNLYSCEKLGTKYGGWYIPKNIHLNRESIVYGVGVGEDISFELMLSDRYNSKIFLIDPTERSKIHFEEIKKFYNDKDFKFTGDIQKDYISMIKDLEVNLLNFTYIDLGLWDKPEKLKFFKPLNSKYVSHSLIENMTSNDFTIVNVDTIKNIMKTTKHEHIDILKLDIEGAEIQVLNNMLDENIYPKILLVEFDLFLKKKDHGNDTSKIINRLKKYYTMLINDNYNITFMIK